MKVIDKIEDIKSIIRHEKEMEKKIGYVPTMGYLHQGHESLISKSVEENDITVVTVFVNPLQFGPGEDYEDYPRDIKRDSGICERLGADYVFAPDAEEMYPDGFSTRVVPDKKMTDILCGKTRPTHFTGVCTVLSKFFTILSPDNVYMGEKDIQQIAIVKRMVKDLNFDLNLKGCPIIREKDGLAKSSRNIYLSDDERKDALCLSQSLQMARDLIEKGEKKADYIRNMIVAHIESRKSTRIDCVEILDFNTFEKVDEIGEDTLIAMAVYVGKTRLIDNTVIK